MPGIYQRDNINYGGMLGNAMQNRARQIERDYDNYMKQPMAWANAVNQTGQTIGNALNQAAQYQYNKDQLAAQQQFQSEQNAMTRANQLQLQREREADALKRAQEQHLWQAEQNRLQQESTERIAGLNRGQTAEEHKAQNIMNYQNALSTMQYAQQALDNARPGSNEYFQAQRDLAYAKSKAEYYQGLIPEQLWYKETVPVITGDVEAEAALKQFGTPAPLKKWQIEDLNNEWKALNERSGGKYDDATAARMNEIADLLNDESLRVKTASKGKTSNQINAEYQAELKAAGNNAAKRALIKKKYGRK